MSRYDAAVIGAGLAGAAAAVRLGQAGLKTVILEARGRVGGRALTRPFAGNGELLEFGGSWITPWQMRVRDHADRAGIKFRQRHPVIEHRQHDGEMLRVGSPSSDEDRPGFDKAMGQIKSDAERFARGGGAHELAAMTLDRYLDRISANRAVRSQVMAWWTISGNGDPARISAGEFLSSCAYGGGEPQGMITALAHTLEPGASVLAESMIAASGAELRLEAAVTHVSEAERGLSIRDAHGGETEADCAALCLPLNVIHRIVFWPPLPDEKAGAAAVGHGGRAVKMWLKIQGVPVGILATGGPNGLRWMFAERETADGAVMVVGFGLSDNHFDPADRNDVERCLLRLMPEARLVAFDWHDWAGDPWAQGTWVALPARYLWIADSGVWQPHGRLAFASSDYAAQSPGWFESAIAAGEEAADALIERQSCST